MNISTLVELVSVPVFLTLVSPALFYDARVPNEVTRSFRVQSFLCKKNTILGIGGVID